MHTTADLYAKLLAIGGNDILRMPEPDLDLLLTRGEVFEGQRVKRVNGEPHRCHENAALYHLLSRGRHAICTGYGLSREGLWFQQSWLDAGEQLVETNSKCRMYFGARLNPLETAMFVMAHVVALLPAAREVVQQAKAA
jgi:hypothetical protein